MCGIAGLWNASPDPGGAQETARAMATTLRHRGPDDAGCWESADGRVALAHRRLSIIDLSPHGRQPMVSCSGRYVIVFNGEIYNHQAIRRELLSDAAFTGSFRGHSDTEVMLAAIDTWGLQPAVQRFVGMFAFGVWDARAHRLFLVRDRLGIKPVYYGWAGSILLFGSELRALARHSAFRREVNRDALALLLRHNCIPAPHCIYRNVYKVMPGTIVSIASPDPRDVTAAPFWSAREVAERGLADPFHGSDAEAISALEALLRDAVKLRMVADVPLGAFLSGGVDSSLVVALMQAQSGRPVKTFSIGAHHADYNEAPYARAVAEHLGTDHTEVYVSAEDALAVVPHLPNIYDEPFADSSQIPTYLVSRVAREHVTIALSGDGGDELFAGYNRHVWGQGIWRTIGWIPPRIRRGAGRALTAVSARTWSRTVEPVQRARGRRVPGVGDKLHKLAGTLGAADPDALYGMLTSHWTAPGEVVLGVEEPGTTGPDRGAPPELPFTTRMLYLDLLTYLPDDILTKVDRASMAVGLEARVPLLDHRVVEFSWRVPLAMKIRARHSKWLLRQVLYRYVPAPLIERPKSGFGVPLGDWLRGALRPWAEALLDERRLAREGYFDSAPIRRKWMEHLSGQYNWEFHLWDVLMFQAWLETAQSRESFADCTEHSAVC